MSSNHIRRLLNIIVENENEPVSQEELSKLYQRGQTVQFIKNTPVGLMPVKELKDRLGKKDADKVLDLAGLVDKTTYGEEFRKGGFVVFQWNSNENRPDIYIADPQAVASRYQKFNGTLPADAKARSKVPSLVVLDQLGIDQSLVPFYVKIVPTEMIRADDVDLAGKTIQTSWGTQTVQAGGFLVREPNGHIYTVAPDAEGLPIGYVPV